MRKFACIVGLISGFNVFVISFLLFFSRAYLEGNNVTQKLGVDICQSQICIKGIIPEKTTWDDAKKIFSISNDGHLDNNDPYEYAMNVEDSSYKFYFWQAFDDPITHASLEIKLGFPPIRLGDLLSDLGSPCALTITEDIVSFQYPNMVFEVPINKTSQAPRDNVFTPTSPINSVSFEKISCKVPFIYPAARNMLVVWCGFASFERYTNGCLNKSDMR